MVAIVLDLEWNGAYSKKTHGYFNEIIEIGAVTLDAHMQPIDSFQAVIRPSVSPKLSSIVTDLTSITEEELAEGGVPFTKAIKQLRQWIGPEEAALLTWSNTDLLVLMEDFRYFYGSERIPFMAYYSDIQPFCQRQLGEDTAQQMGLSKACELAGITVEDADLHRAPDDSLLTARLFAQLYDEETFRPYLYAVDEEFYRRVTFKPVIISDIESPLVKRSELRFACEVCGRNLRRTGEWRFRNRAFCADFVCAACQKTYSGRVQFKLKYEGIQVRRRLMETKAKNEAAGAETAAKAAESLGV